MCNKNISQIVLNCYWKYSQILSYLRLYRNMYSHAMLTNDCHHIVNLTITRGENPYAQKRNCVHIQKSAKNEICVFL